MLLPRISRCFLHMNTLKNICTSCLARQHATYATASPQSKDAPATLSSTPPTRTKPALSRPDLSHGPPKRKRRLWPTPPQPGPPSPPYNEAPAVRPKVFTTEKSLTKDAIMTAKLCYPTKYFPENQAMTVPVLSVGVPRAPDFVNDYTSMGPDIVASWRPGGPFRRLGGNEIRTANRASSIGVAAAFAGTKGSSKNYGLSIRYTFGHALHPWHAKYLVASPGFDEVAYDGGLGGPVGFPHSAAEIFRRRYAIKNRTEPLWWFVTVFPGDSDLPYSNLVRHKLRFKLQSAFRTALKQRGYNLVGVRLDGLDGKLARFQQLYGSVRVDGMTQPLLDVTYDELVAYLCQVVVAVEGHLGGRKQGQTLPKQKRPGRLGRPDKADPAPEDGWTADEEGFQVVGSGTRQGGGLAKANSDLQPKPSKGSAKPYKSRGKQSDDDFVVLRGLGY